MSAWLKFTGLKPTLWPSPEGEHEQPERVPVCWISEKLQQEVDPGKIESMYNLANMIAAAERERLETASRKTFTLFGATGILSAIALGLGKLLLSDMTCTPTAVVAIICVMYAIILTYFFRAAYFCLLVMDVARFYVIGPKDVCDVQEKTNAEYLKTMTVRLLEHTERNYRVTNQKIDNFATARECFQLGIFMLLVLGMFFAAYSLVVRIID